ncbi:hypothetical protein CUMW_168740 [Citrus unshiu]|uniref:Uncharacterized protein n=1 Tax=Citrus unshiu TaxID=55188 RepID=A0A2H5PUL9_CITUN|nr:hypothetical protein CUMW_168740 [Citrus unshiu]
MSWRILSSGLVRESRRMQCSDFRGAFVRGVDSVSWMANNSTKLLSSQSDGSHYWTFFNTAAYGERKQGSTGKYANCNSIEGDNRYARGC